MGKRVLWWIMLIALIFNNTFSSFLYAFDDGESFVVVDESQSGEEWNEQTDLDSVDVESDEDEETDEEDEVDDGEGEEIDEETDDEEWIDDEDEIDDGENGEIHDEEDWSDSEQNSWDNTELSWSIEILSWDVENLSWDIERLTWSTEILNWNNEVLSWDIENLTWNAEELTWDAEELTWDAEELSWDIEDLDWNIENLDISDEFNEIRDNLNEEIIYWQDMYNDVIVSVEAPIWSFPEWTELRITPIRAINQQQEIKDQLVENTEVSESSEIVSFDISFIYKLLGWEEVELQPLEWKTVKVVFNYVDNDALSDAEVDNNKELKVYHLEEVVDEEWNKTYEVEVKEIAVKESADWELVVDAEKFSVYSVAGVELRAAMCTVTFQNGHCYFNYWTNTADDGICTFDMPTSIQVECGQTISRQDIDEPNHCTLAWDNNQTWNYYFAKWSTQIAPGATNTSYNYDFSTPVNSDITLYAIWSYSHYNWWTNNYSRTVTFNANQWILTSPSSVIYWYRGLVKQPSDPVRIWYVLNCWTTSQNGSCTNAYNFNSTTNVITENITLYAQWTPLEYTITFDANWWTGFISDINAEYDSDYVLPKTGFTLSWYLLSSWNTQSNGGGTWYAVWHRIRNLTIINNDLVTLYAQWLEAATVTFNSNGWSSVNSQLVALRSSAEEPDDPIKTGYSFVAWYSDPELTSEFNFLTSITWDITLYAGWEGKWNPITVSFITDWWSPVPPQEIYSGDTVTKPSDPTMNNKIFSYWSTDSQWNNEFDFNTIVTWDLILYANWSDVCTVTFRNGTCYRTNNNTTATCTFLNNNYTVDVACGTPVRRPEDPNSPITVNGRTYYFSTWATRQNPWRGTTTYNYNFDTAVTWDIDLYAIGYNNSYTVTFNANWWTLSNDSSVEVDSDTIWYYWTVRQPDDPVRTWYVFKWRYRTQDNWQAYNFNTQVTSSFTLYAQWDPVTYTIKYNANGWTWVMSDSDMTYDIAVNLKTNTFTKSHAVFNGWNTSANWWWTWYSDGESVINLTYSDRTVINLYAQWSCESNYHNENWECVSNTQQVACDASGIPENATSSWWTVQITWNGNGWSSPAPCSWSCNTWYTQSGNSCVPSSCTFNDQIIANWESVLAYQTSSVPFGQSCVSETRVCTNGILSWSYGYANCAPEAPSSCNFQWQTIAHNGSLTVYSSASEMCPNTCTMWTVTCWNGTLGWDTGYTNLSCSPVATICDASFTLTSTGANGTYSSCTPYTANGNSCSAWTTVYKLNSCNSGFHTEDWVSCISNSSTAQCSTGSTPANATPTIITVPITRSNGSWSDPAPCAWNCNTHYHPNSAETGCDIDTFEITWVDWDGHTLTTTTVNYNVVPTYSWPTPTKTATAQHSYSFNWNWSPTPVAATTGATYTAQFDSSVNQYTATISVNNPWYGSVSITWVTADWWTSISTGSNNTIIIWDKTITPTPTANSAEFTYKFENWTNTCRNTLTEDCTITANFSQTRNEYVITFKDRDWREIDSWMVAYGTMPTPPAAPTRESTQQYTYNFSGWTPEITSVVWTATYTAVYTETVNQYTATISANPSWYWTVSLGSVKKDYWATISENGNKITIWWTEVTATPTPSSDEFTYTFLGWSNNCGNELTDDCTITANFGRNKNKYQLTINIFEWQMWFGTLSTWLIIAEYWEHISINWNQLIIWDQTVTANETWADAQYTYAFSGWINNCWETFTGNCTVVAEFTRELNEYSVQFMNYDWSVLQSWMWVFGATPQYTWETPTKPATAQYTYSFTWWSPAVSSVAGDIVYTAQFSETINEYTVVWKNEDWTVLETDENVPYGTLPTYNWTIPQKTGNQQYTYTFAGWTPSVSSVNWNIAYTATYTESVNQYTVSISSNNTWYGTVNTISVTANYWSEIFESGNVITISWTDVTAIVTGSDVQYTYSFVEWNNTCGNTLTDDCSIVAIFDRTINKYNVTFVDEDWVTILKETTSYDYGTLSWDIVKPLDPTKARTSQYTYTFAWWSPEISTVIENITYRATYSSVVNKYDIIFNSNGGTNVALQNIEYWSKVAEPADPTKTWYTFDDWYTDTELSQVYDFDETIETWFTLYAKWNLVNYSISYELNGGSLTWWKTNPTNYTVESEVITLNNPGKSGYVFNWWTGSNGEEPEVVVTIPSGSVGNREYTATWNKDVVEYEVTYKDSKWNTLVETKTATWLMDEEVTEVAQIISWYVTPADQSLTLDWTGNKIDFVYQPRNDTEYKVIHIYTWTADGVWSSTVTVIHTGTTDTYVTWELSPRSWFVTPTEQEIFIKPDGSASVTYVYEREGYTLSYNSNSWTTVGSKTIKYEGLNKTNKDMIYICRMELIGKDANMMNDIRGNMGSEYRN